MTRFSPAFVAGGSLVAWPCHAPCSRRACPPSARRLSPATRSRPLRLVTTAVTVRERDGRLVSNLSERDFVIDRRRPSAGIGALHLGADATQRGDCDRHEPESSRRAHAGDARRGSAIHRRVATTGRRSGARQLQPRGQSSRTGRLIGLACGRVWTRSLRPAARRSTTRCSRPCRSSRRGAFSAQPCIMSDGADSASDTTPTQLKKQLTGTDVFLYWIAVDHVDARAATRINPYTIA